MDIEELNDIFGLNDEEKDEKYIRDCYKIIYNWHSKIGINEIDNRDLSHEKYKKEYKILVKNIPEPSIACQSDMDFIFKETISNHFEWAYQTKDESGKKLGDIAKGAINRKYSKGFGDSSFEHSVKDSKLNLLY